MARSNEILIATYSVVLVMGGLAAFWEAADIVLRNAFLFQGLEHEWPKKRLFKVLKPQRLTLQ